MDNSWRQGLMHPLLQGVALKQLIHILVILVILITVMSVSVKGWINPHSPEILPYYWIYYILLFCVNYMFNGVVNSAYHVVTERIEVSAAQKRKSKEEKYMQGLFDPSTLGERAYLVFAVAASNQSQTKKGAYESASLLEKGLLIRGPPAVGYPDTDCFVIPRSYRCECYVRFVERANSLMDESIAQNKYGKNKQLANEFTILPSVILISGSPPHKELRSEDKLSLHTFWSTLSELSPLSSLLV